MSDSDLLSQDEIDALLSGVDSGDIEVDAVEHEEEGGATTYDFASQDRIVRGRLPTLEMINERFARNLRLSLFEMLRRAPSISVEGVQMMKFGEYIQTLLTPSSLHIVRVTPLRGSGMFVFNPKLVFSLVDCFFGGDGKAQRKHDAREFTASEMRIVRKALELTFDGLRDAWKPVLPVDFEYLNAEINPQFAAIASASEVVVVSTFHIDLDGGSGDLHIAMPYSMIEPIRSLLDSGARSDGSEKDARWSTVFQEEMKSARVQLSSTLAHGELTVRDVLGMKPGDVLSVDIPETIVARVGDVPVFRATYGVSRGNFALKVVEPMRHADLTPQEIELGACA